MCRRATRGYRQVLVKALFGTAVFSVSAGLHWLSARKLRRGPTCIDDLARLSRQVLRPALVLRPLPRRSRRAPVGESEVAPGKPPSNRPA